MKDSKINWTHHTFNPWIGCSRVSAGCVNCYAETQNNQRKWTPGWGPGQPRRPKADSMWREPFTWDKAAAVGGERQRVFCASLAGWCDAEAPKGQLDRLWAVIRQTPNLDWLMLTKRDERIALSLPDDWGVTGYPHVWLGVSVENKKQGLARIDTLRTIPAAVRFLSIEPLIEDLGQIDFAGIGWATIGGEYGPGARPMDTQWVASIVDQCQAQGVAAWVKQLGTSPTESGSNLVVIDIKGKKSSHNGDLQVWSDHLAELKVRELPSVDTDAISMRIDEVELGKVETALGKLAASLEPDAAEKELELRTRYLTVERSMFMPRRERGKLIAEFHSIYAPLRMWSAFLKAIAVSRRTAYELIEAAEESVRKPHAPPKPEPDPPSIDDAVEQA